MTIIYVYGPRKRELQILILRDIYHPKTIKQSFIKTLNAFI